jgi:type IV pilus assembly protein PilC
MKGLKLPQQAPSRSASAPSSQGQSSIWDRNLRLGPVLRLKDRRDLFQLLGILLGSGLGIIDCLEVLQDQARNPAIRQLLDQIRGQLADGLSLSESLARQAAHFTDFEVYSLRMGEQTGKTPAVLSNLASLYEKRIKLRRKVIQALSYPVAVILIALLVLTFMITFVVPMFQDIFARFDAELPPITRAILRLSDFALAYGLYALGTGIVAGILAWRMRNHPLARSGSSYLLLRTPFLGQLLLKLHLARMCYTFSSLLAARVNLDRALELLEKLITFYPLQLALVDIRKAVIEGSSLYEALRVHPVFPVFVTQIIKVGEKTAQLDQMIEKLAQSLEEESEAGISQLTQFLEPLLIVILGVMVAVILISMYLPMFELSNAIGM